VSKSKKKKKSPKRVLALPDLEQSKSAVLNTLTSKSGQRSYEHAMDEFVEGYCSEPRLALNRTVVLRYRIHLEQKQYAPSTINLRLAAVRRVAYEAADWGLLSPELAAGIRRVKGVRRLGVRVGNWLTAEQGKRLLQGSARDHLRGMRNYAMLAMLIGCGLRRGELLALNLDSIQLREEQASSADLRFRSAAFHPESSLSFSNPRAPTNGQECAIVTKPNRSYRNGRRRRHTAKIYAPAQRDKAEKSRTWRRSAVLATWSNVLLKFPK